MVLELLESLERLEARVGVIETDDEADVDAILVEVVQEAAAIGLAVHRIADRVLDKSRLDPAFRQLPQFLEAKTVSLR